MTTDPTPDPSRLAPDAFANAVLTRRLVDRHDLDPDTARTAVLDTRARRPNPHTDLVRAEAAAFLTEVIGPIAKELRRIFETLRPAIVAIGRQWQAAIDQMPATAQVEIARRTEHTRPAWESPYGPPQQRHRS